MRWPPTSRSSGGWPARGSASRPSSRPTATGTAWRSPRGPSWPAGADLLCVATLDEAIALRAAGIDAPVLVLFPSRRSGRRRCRARSVELVAAEADSLARHARRLAGSAAAGLAGSLRVHLEIETGLARAGFRPERCRGRRAAIATRPTSSWPASGATSRAPTMPARPSARSSASGPQTAAIRSAGLAVPPRHLAATGACSPGRGRRSSWSDPDSRSTGSCPMPFRSPTTGPSWRPSCGRR